LKENRVGVLTSRLATEAALVEGILGTRLAYTIQNISTIIAGIAVAFISGWKLTLITVAVSPLIGALNYNIVLI
jgi:ABC-type multidrug transport system fused ATPase/permease subunit